MTSDRIKLLYGYSVCLITLIVALFSARSTLQAALDLVTPSNQFGSPVSTSFEAYLAEHPTTLVPRSGDTAQDTASVETLRRRWTALREDQMTVSRARAIRELATSALLLLLAVAAFIFHWRWMRSDAGHAAGEPRLTGGGTSKSLD
ncbi:MAG: hypothetical protein ABI910_23550 [Gemmatimonadota bacterium]